MNGRRESLRVWTNKRDRVKEYYVKIFRTNGVFPFFLLSLYGVFVPVSNLTGSWWTIDDRQPIDPCCGVVRVLFTSGINIHLEWSDQLKCIAVHTCHYECSLAFRFHTSYLLDKRCRTHESCKSCFIYTVQAVSNALLVWSANKTHKGTADETSAVENYYQVLSISRQSGSDDIISDKGNDAVDWVVLCCCLEHTETHLGSHYKCEEARGHVFQITSECVLWDAFNSVHLYLIKFSM